MKKWIIPIVTLVILVGGVAAGIFLVRQSTEFREKAAPATTLSFETADTTVNVGDSFVVMSTINSGENSVVIAQMAIDYDPAILQVDSVSKGNFFGASANETTPKILPGEKLIDYSVFLPLSSTPIQGTGTVAIISFKALTEGVTTLSYIPQKNYTYQGSSYKAQTIVSSSDESVNLISTTNPITIAVVGNQTAPTATPTGTQVQDTPTPSPTGTTIPTGTPTPTPTPTDDSGIGGTDLPTSTPTPTPTSVAATATPTPAQLEQNLTSPTNTPTTVQLMDSGVSEQTIIYLLLGAVSILASGLFVLTIKD